MKNQTIKTIEERQTSLTEKLRELKGSVDRSDLAVEMIPDLMDNLTRAADHDMIVDRLNRTSETLQAVRTALIALETGTYGYCLECENQIPPKRLDAIPWARYCVACQESIDQFQPSARFGDAHLSEAA